MIGVPAIVHLSKICARHLVAEDPYQYEHLTINQLITVVISTVGTKELFNDIRRRLNNDSLSRDEREILTKLLGFERRGKNE